ncbi:MAG: hypothetical protein JSU96_10575, partial [Acidobacteriota bacterium]
MTHRDRHFPSGAATWNRLSRKVILWQWLIGAGILSLSQVTSLPGQGQRAELTETHEQEPRFTIQTYSSLLELRVLRPDGAMVSGLEVADFSISRQGKSLSPIYLEERRNAGLSLGILIDIGSEMNGENIRIAKQAVFDLIHLLEPTDQVLIGVYNNDVDFLSELSADRVALVRALEHVASGGRPGFFSRFAAAFASSGNTGFAVDQCLLKMKPARYDNKVILAFSASFGNTGEGTREHLELAGTRFFAVTWKNRIGDAFNLWSDRFARGDVVDSSGGVAFTGRQIVQQLGRLRETLKSFYLLAYDPGDS